VVLGLRAGTSEELAEIAHGQGVLEHHVKPFVDAVRFDLSDLYEGNIARFRLRPSEFSTWKRGR
jgi:hypothetical protein